MLENGAVAPLLEGLKHKKYEVRSASVFALGESLQQCTPLL
jgi:HEAT repeat protein